MAIHLAFNFSNYIFHFCMHLLLSQIIMNNFILSCLADNFNFLLYSWNYIKIFILYFVPSISSIWCMYNIEAYTVHVWASFFFSFGSYLCWLFPLTELWILKRTLHLLQHYVYRSKEVCIEDFFFLRGLDFVSAKTETWEYFF